MLFHFHRWLNSKTNINTECSGPPALRQFLVTSRYKLLNYELFVRQQKHIWRWAQPFQSTRGASAECSQLASALWCTRMWTTYATRARQRIEWEVHFTDTARIGIAFQSEEQRQQQPPRLQQLCCKKCSSFSFDVVVEKSKVSVRTLHPASALHPICDAVKWWCQCRRLQGFEVFAVNWFELKSMKRLPVLAKRTKI